MVSIPFDPTLNLGQIVIQQKMLDLMEMAEISATVDAAMEKMNNLIRISYSLTRIKQEMVNIGLTDDDKLAKLEEKVLQIKNASVDAAIEYADISVEGEELTNAAKVRQGQKAIGKVPESPIDYQQSTVTSFPLASDSLKFDVQYVRNETQEDSSYSHTSSLSSAAGASMSTLAGPNYSASYSASTSSSINESSSSNKIEGTIVISAFATHKNASVIDPFILDPDKAVSTWNQMYPDDFLDVNPKGIIGAAMEADTDKKPIAEKKTVNLLSGCNKASSFVAFVHVLQEEATKSSQSASSSAASMQAQIETELWAASISGSFGTSMSSSTMSKSITSTSRVENHANLVCNGCIPNIAANTVTTTVRSLKPDPTEIMGSLGAMQEGSNNAMTNNLEAAAGGAKTGTAYQSLNEDFLSNSVSAINDITNEDNKIIDINSVFNAFTQFVTNAQEGDGGVPLNFMIKRLSKADIAKCYIRRYYPNGASDPKAAKRGMLGLGPKEGGEE
mmetsp:Transcript_2818/g.3327  ORF Transcript_2818/g.3327 Transcript_2818/m.3327 type:complete len:503 (-) Transcript_2818:63-1571(-)